MENIFKTRKIAALKKWTNAVDENKVDIEVIPLVELINGFDHYYTTSSCAGRLTIISKSAVRSKYHTDFIFKSHNPNELSIEKIGYPIEFKQKELWMLLEPPNFHIGAKNLDYAETMVKLALNSGLGKSKFQSISPGIVVEILGTGHMSLPLGFDGEMAVSKEYLKKVLKIASSMLEEEQIRLARFHEQLTKFNF